MREPHRFARRFIGGETLEEAISVAGELGQHGFTHTLNHLGEHITSPNVAQTATREYVSIINKVDAAGLPCKISVKL